MRIHATIACLRAALDDGGHVALVPRLASSEGDYPRRISQRAVQNIAALGGGGAAAIVQRGFLGAMKEFGYSKIGLSCRLERGVCHMDGVVGCAPGLRHRKGRRHSGPHGHRLQSRRRLERAAGTAGADHAAEHQPCDPIGAAP